MGIQYFDKIKSVLTGGSDTDSEELLTGSDTDGEELLTGSDTDSEELLTSVASCRPQYTGTAGVLGMIVYIWRISWGFICSK